jgi:hypothetical protein
MATGSAKRSVLSAAPTSAASRSSAKCADCRSPADAGFHAGGGVAVEDEQHQSRRRCCSRADRAVTTCRPGSDRAYADTRELGAHSPHEAASPSGQHGSRRGASERRRPRRCTRMLLDAWSSQGRPAARSPGKGQRRRRVLPRESRRDIPKSGLDHRRAGSTARPHVVEGTRSNYTTTTRRTTAATRVVSRLAPLTVSAAPRTSSELPSVRLLGARPGAHDPPTAQSLHLCSSRSQLVNRLSSVPLGDGG